MYTKSERRTEANETKNYKHHRFMKNKRNGNKRTTLGNKKIRKASGFVFLHAFINQQNEKKVKTIIEQRRSCRQDVFCVV